MSLKYSIGFGMLAGVVMSVVGLLFAPIGFSGMSYGWVVYEIIIFTIAAILGFILARVVKPKTIGQGICYGLVWVGIAIIWEVLVELSPFGGFFSRAIFGNWVPWIEYALFFIGAVVGSLMASAKAQGWDKKPTKKSNKVEPPEEIGEGGPSSPMR